MDEVRRERGRDGTRPRLVREDPEVLAAAEPARDDDPLAAFHRQWATALFETALTRVEHTCRQDGMNRHWAVFESRVLEPLFRRTLPTPIEELVDRLDARGPEEISACCKR